MKMQASSFAIYAAPYPDPFTLESPRDSAATSADDRIPEEICSTAIVIIWLFLGSKQSQQICAYWLVHYDRYFGSCIALVHVPLRYSQPAP
jgi:hypothetical protein